MIDQLESPVLPKILEAPQPTCRPGRAIKFFVAGTPKPQPRPRAFARRVGDRLVARVYDAGTAEHWKSQIALAARPHMPTPIITGPVSLLAIFYFSRPKFHFRSNGSLKESAPRRHINRPDTENCVKAVMDCLTQLGFWRDDCQVCESVVFKLYSEHQTGALIEIAELEANETTNNTATIAKRSPHPA